MRPRILDLGAELVPYDRPRFGDYPAIVEDELTNPKYRLLYANGRIVSRSDIEVNPPVT